jgi:hypothetical protein
MQLDLITHGLGAGTNHDLSAYGVAEGVWAMPIWLEFLINIIGYGGFVAIAMYHRSSGEKLPEQDRR